MHTSERQAAKKEDISPFHWRRHRAQAEAGERPASKPRRARAASAAPQSAEAKAARVLAHRWGNPYSRPGWP